MHTHILIDRRIKKPAFGVRCAVVCECVVISFVGKKNRAFEFQHIHSAAAAAAAAAIQHMHEMQMRRAISIWSIR